MKVYESSHPIEKDYTRVPQIKIKNKKLEECGFTPGTEFKVIYTKNKILLKVIPVHTNQLKVQVEREVNYV